MTQSELADEVGVKLIERLSSGEYMVRYGFHEVEGGIRYMEGKFPYRPTAWMLRRSIIWYVRSLEDAKEKDDALCTFDIVEYLI